MKTEQERPSTPAQWIAELTDNELNAAQRAALTDWMRESPTNIRALIEGTLLANDLRELPLTRELVEAWTREARAAARDVIPLRTFSQSARHSRGDEPRTYRKYWATAACLVLGLAAIAGYFEWVADRYSTGMGEQRILTLDDGSVVSLNTQSSLSVQFSSDKRRIELLKGEAFFRVAQEKSRPFEVTVEDATVKAVGTQFNIRVAPQATVVSVTDGRVIVKDKDEVLLGAGEEVRIERPTKGLAEKPVVLAKSARPAALRASAWTQGRVEFEQASLAEVLEEFQRYRKLDVHIADPALGNLKLTGSFDAHDPQSALAYIETIPGIAVDRDADGRVVIRRK